MTTVEFKAINSSTVNCPICGGRDFVLLTREDRYRMGVPTSVCSNCGLAMTNPMPTDSALEEFYRRDYRRLYRKSAVPDPAQIRRLRLTERARYTVDHLLSSGAIPEAGKVLDVGCAEGSLLQAITAAGPATRCTGIEPGEGYRAYATQHCPAEILQDLAAVEDTRQRFDLVIVNHVLEHVREPVPFLLRLRALLEPGGRVYVDVPDATRYSSVADLHIAHLYHFTPHTLAAVANRARLLATGIDRHRPPAHPRSVRAILTKDRAEPAAPHCEIDRDPDAANVAAGIRRAAALSPVFHAVRGIGSARAWIMDAVSGRGRDVA